MGCGLEREWDVGGVAGVVAAVEGEEEVCESEVEA